MKKILILLAIVLLCTSCTNLANSGMSPEQIQTLAQQTIDARDFSPTATPFNAGNIVIRPLSTMASGGLIVRKTAAPAPTATKTGSGWGGNSGSWGGNASGGNSGSSWGGSTSGGNSGSSWGGNTSGGNSGTSWGGNTSGGNSGTSWGGNTSGGSNWGGSTSGNGGSGYQKPGVCDRVRFLEDVTVPDDTVMMPGQFFRKTWKIQNAGSCTWDRGYMLVFSGGEVMSSKTAVSLPKTVAPGEIIELSVDMNAPKFPGVYESKWKMRSSNGQLFGTSDAADSSLWARIRVEDNGGNYPAPGPKPGPRPAAGTCTVLSVVPSRGTAYKRGEEFDIFFTVRNDSNITWESESFDIAFIEGTNLLKRQEKTRIDMTKSVKPGETIKIGLDARAPQDAGTFTMTMGIVRGYEVMCTMDASVRSVY